MFCCFFSLFSCFSFCFCSCSHSTAPTTGCGGTKSTGSGGQGSTTE